MGSENSPTTQGGKTMTKIKIDMYSNNPDLISALDMINLNFSSKIVMDDDKLKEFKKYMSKLRSIITDINIK